VEVRGKFHDEMKFNDGFNIMNSLDTHTKLKNNNKQTNGDGLKNLIAKSINVY